MGGRCVPDENYEEALDALENRTPDAAAEPPPAQHPPPPARPLPPPPPVSGTPGRAAAGVADRGSAKLRIAGRFALGPRRRVGLRGSYRQRDQYPQRLGEHARAGAVQRPDPTWRHDRRIAPRRAELSLLPRRPEDPAGIEGPGQEPPRGDQFPPLGRSGAAGLCRGLAASACQTGRGPLDGPHRDHHPGSLPALHRKPAAQAIMPACSREARRRGW